MSSLLYLLSYSLIKTTSAGRGIAPPYAGHEPIMLLLHQPAFLFLFLLKKHLHTTKDKLFFFKGEKILIYIYRMSHTVAQTERLKLELYHNLITVN